MPQQLPPLLYPIRADRAALDQKTNHTFCGYTLQDSLGGNCKTTFMAMISPALEAFAGEAAAGHLHC